MDDASGVKTAISITQGIIERSSELFRAKDAMTVVIFGASGDLSKRRLIPALYHLQEAGYLPDRYAVVGFSRTDMTDAAYRESTLKALQEQVKDGTNLVKADNPFVSALHYQAGNSDDPESFRKLKHKLDTLDKERNLTGNRLFYLAVGPELFPTIIRNLCAAGLICGKHDKTWSRVVIEKPFGKDLENARTLNADITAVLDESQIYRIDHYLGKETVSYRTLCCNYSA
jgi:glucose-6-phosphate 1-dehydrogenase